MSCQLAYTLDVGAAGILAARHAHCLTRAVRTNSKRLLAHTKLAPQSLSTALWEDLR